MIVGIILILAGVAFLWVQRLFEYLIESCLSVALAIILIILGIGYILT